MGLVGYALINALPGKVARRFCESLRLLVALLCWTRKIQNLAAVGGLLFFSPTGFLFFEDILDLRHSS